MKIAIRYYTKSKKGNTRKLADAVSQALGVEALDVSAGLEEKADRLFLINAMYAADVDREIKTFLEENRAMIGEVVNMNTAATGASTRKAVKRVTEPLGIPLCEQEFHCVGSWVFLNRGLPSEADLARAKDFAKSLA